MDNYFELYIYQCSLLNKGYTKRDVRTHNTAMKELSKIYIHFKGVQDRSIFVKLLRNESLQVQLMAAAHCLGLNEYIDKAKKVLSQLARDKSNAHIAFEAQAILDIWEQQGYLSFGDKNGSVVPE